MRTSNHPWHSQHPLQRKNPLLIIDKITQNLSEIADRARDNDRLETLFDLGPNDSHIASVRDTNLDQYLTPPWFAEAVVC